MFTANFRPFGLFRRSFSALINEHRPELAD